MEALEAGVARILNGEETAREYHEEVEVLN
jgi:butyrate kinase